MFWTITKHVPMLSQINEEKQKINKELVSWDVADRPLVNRLQPDKCYSEDGRNCIGPFSTFLAVLLHCIQQILEPHVIYLAHRFDARQAVILIHFLCRWAELNALWWRYFLNNVFGHYRSISIWRYKGTQRIWASSSCWKLTSTGRTVHCHRQNVGPGCALREKHRHLTKHFPYGSRVWGGFNCAWNCVPFLIQHDYQHYGSWGASYCQHVRNGWGYLPERWWRSAIWWIDTSESTNPLYDHTLSPQSSHADLLLSDNRAERLPATYSGHKHCWDHVT